MAHTDSAILRTAIVELKQGPGVSQEIVGDALRRIPGVAGVVRQQDGKLAVRYDPSMTSPDQFRNVAEQAGFETAGSPV